jgi:arabinogalactan oligomer / maltooligosaccharide transport system permease protein
MAITELTPPTPEITERLHAPRRNVLGLVVKLIALGLIDAVALFAIFALIGSGNAMAALLVAVPVLGINWLYLTARAVPAKYLVPGTLAMAVFGVLPIIYTVFISFTNYSTGNVTSKSDAIERISADGYVDITDYALQVVRDDNGRIAYVLVKFDEDTGEAIDWYVGRPGGLTALDPPIGLDPDTFEIEVPAGFTALDPDEAEELVSSGAANFRVPLEGDRFIAVDTTETAWERSPLYVYDAAKDAVLDVQNDLEYANNGQGNFVGVDPETGDRLVLQPGWRETVGFQNFNRILSDPLIRDPFGRVFLWTIIYAFSSVFLTFSLGLAIALVFNVPKMKGRRLYRAILVVPYAIPGFLSLLVWRGLMNQQWGLINNLLGAEIPWLEEPTLAKISILIVNTWLGFPYFFLVATGALQAIPAELKEAASVDGANRIQVFRSITLPLLLVATGPLLVASFAYNFNNFNQIFLLTGGGPALSGERSVAGATDILISYTYKIAFAAGKGNDYALAAAISIIIFFIIGAISFWSFKRSKALENMS